MIGVGSCWCGWIAVARTADKLACCIKLTIDDLAFDFSEAKRILVDVPIGIGLPWADIPIRPCDRLVRQLLSEPRRRNVFAVPCRVGRDRHSGSAESEPINPWQEHR